MYLYWEYVLKLGFFFWRKKLIDYILYVFVKCEWMFIKEGNMENENLFEI